MVHPCPGNPAQDTKWYGRDFLRMRGFNGQVAWLYVQCAIPYSSFDPQLLPVGSKARKWVDSQAAVSTRICGSRARPAFPNIRYRCAVGPKILIEKYGPQMMTGRNWISVSR